MLSVSKQIVENSEWPELTQMEQEQHGQISNEQQIAQEVTLEENDLEKPQMFLDFSDDECKKQTSNMKQQEEAILPLNENEIDCFWEFVRGLNRQKESTTETNIIALNYDPEINDEKMKEELPAVQEQDQQITIFSGFLCGPSIQDIHVELVTINNNVHPLSKFPKSSFDDISIQAQFTRGEFQEQYLSQILFQSEDKQNNYMVKSSVNINLGQVWAPKNEDNEILAKLGEKLKQSDSFIVTPWNDAEQEENIVNLTYLNMLIIIHPEQLTQQQLLMFKYQDINQILECASLIYILACLKIDEEQAKQNNIQFIKPIEIQQQSDNSADESICVQQTQKQAKQLLPQQKNSVHIELLEKMASQSHNGQQQKRQTTRHNLLDQLQKPGQFAENIETLSKEISSVFVPATKQRNAIMQFKQNLQQPQNQYVENYQPAYQQPSLKYLNDKGALLNSLNDVLSQDNYNESKLVNNGAQNQQMQHGKIIRNASYFLQQRPLPKIDIRQNTQNTQNIKIQKDNMHDIQSQIQKGQQMQNLNLKSFLCGTKSIALDDAQYKFQPTKKEIISQKEIQDIISDCNRQQQVTIEQKYYQHDSKCGKQGEINHVILSKSDNKIVEEISNKTKLSLPLNYNNPQTTQKLCNLYGKVALENITPTNGVLEEEGEMLVRDPNELYKIKKKKIEAMKRLEDEYVRGIEFDIYSSNDDENMSQVSQISSRQSQNLSVISQRDIIEFENDPQVQIEFQQFCVNEQEQNYNAIPIQQNQNNINFIVKDHMHQQSHSIYKIKVDEYQTDNENFLYSTMLNHQANFPFYQNNTFKKHQDEQLKRQIQQQQLQKIQLENEQCFENTSDLYQNIVFNIKQELPSDRTKSKKKEEISIYSV